MRLGKLLLRPCGDGEFPAAQSGSEAGRYANASSRTRRDAAWVRVQLQHVTIEFPGSSRVFHQRHAVGNVLDAGAADAQRRIGFP